MMKNSMTVALVASCLFLNSGCQTPTDHSAQIQSLESRLAAVEKQLADGAARPGDTQVVATSSPSPSLGASATPTSAEATSTPNAGGDLWKQLSYDTLPTPERLQEIVSLGFLPKAGITNQAEFEGGLTRGQYIALMVEMNNLLHEPASQIRLAREGDGQTFDDVPSSHPYYKYIQGMVDAGYVIGFNEKTFQPDKALTREELVAIMAKRDYDFKHFDSKYYWENYLKFTDKGDIAPKYREAICKDDGQNERSNLREAFGELKLFHPKKEARVYEAVLSLYQIGNYSHYRYQDLVAKGMGKK